MTFSHFYLLCALIIIAPKLSTPYAIGMGAGYAVISLYFFWRGR